MIAISGIALVLLRQRQRRFWFLVGQQSALFYSRLLAAGTPVPRTASFTRFTNEIPRARELLEREREGSPVVSHGSLWINPMAFQKHSLLQFETGSIRSFDIFHSICITISYPPNFDATLPVRSLS